MIHGARLLVTGPAGQIATDLCARLVAAGNEVWGAARFSVPGSEERCQRAGIRTVRCDLAAGELGVLPEVDFVLHLAASQRPDHDYDAAIRANAEATGLLMQRYAGAVEAMLVMSTHSVYAPHDDPEHVFAETDPLGDPKPLHSPTYGVSKLMNEGVARAAARMFGVPTVIARMNASYGPAGGLPVIHLRRVAAGETVTTRWDPCPYQPIHADDIAGQVGDLLGAASVPATIVNWAGDEVVTVQEWVTHFAALLGVPARVDVVPVPGTLRGSIADVTLRRSITGPCRVGWRAGFAELADQLGER